jgi:uncharacterized protein
MGKIIFWIVVLFAVLFAVRLINVAKAKARRERAERQAKKAALPGEATVRCERCGVFLPKSEALVATTGYRCSDPACARGR